MSVPIHIPITFQMKTERVCLAHVNSNKTSDLHRWCKFVSQSLSGPSEVWAAAGAVMSGALRGQDRNYWTEGGWQRDLALGANRCCNHKEIHNLWIKYEEREQQEWRMVMTFSLLVGQSRWFVACLSTTDWSVVVTRTRWIISHYAGFLKRT